MPLVKRAIEPADISRGHLTSEVKNELECVANNTLACIIQQLSSLSKHSDDLFGELYAETCTLATRTNNIITRLEKLKLKIVQLNPTVEEVLLQEINLRKPFKSSMCRDQQIMVRSTRPFSMNEVYRWCEAPPALNKLDVFREDGKDSLKFYTDPNYFVELWYSDMKAAQHQQKKQKHKHGQLLKASNRPKTLRAPKSRIEEFRDLRHGPEFVEKLRQEHACEEIATPTPRLLNKNSEIAHYSYSQTELHAMPGRNHNAHFDRDYVPNASTSEGYHQHYVDNHQEEKSRISGCRSNSVVQISSPRPSGPPPAPPVLKKQSSASQSAINQSSRMSSVQPSAAASHLQQSQASPGDHQVPHRVESSLAGIPVVHHFDELANFENLPPPPPSPPKDNYSFVYPGQMHSPSSVPPPPVIAGDHENQVSPLPPPPPLPESLLNEVYTSPSGRQEGDVSNAVIGKEDLSPMKNQFPQNLQLDQESIASNSSSATCEVSVASDAAKTAHVDKGPLIRDTRSDLLSAIREGIQLRKVEENRLKSEQNKKAGGPLDVQSIMEAAFEMRRKALEENDSDQDEDDDENNWSD